MTAHIGSPTSRVEGRDKVTGAAKYAGEFNAPGLVHASIVGSTIAKGRIARIDASEALKIGGVIAVLTHENRPPMADTDDAYKDDVAPEQGSPFRPLYDGKILFSGQPIALVLAEDSETARFAATHVRVDYEAEPHVTDFHAKRGDAFALDEPAKPRGDAAAALAAAEVRHQGEYSVPMEHHNPMELFASTVMWEGDGKLTIYDKTQGVQNVQRYVCGIFGLKPADVRVMSPFVGGAFGSGLRPQYQVVLAVLAARALERSVRVVLTRQQMYGLGYRPAMIQRIELGAKADGTLEALTHDAITVTSQYEDFHRHETTWSGLLYKSASAKYAHKLVRLDLPTSCDMRAPSATTGVYALESAMDELAVALKIDPLELRMRSYSEHDQNSGLPYSSKSLRECYRQGAEAFGWSKRNPEPRAMRDGSELVGWGMATGIWEALQVPITVRVALTANGHAQVSCATSDIGTGTYTIMTQVAADMLGLPLESIDIKLGDSTLPQSPVEGGSWIAASVSNGIVTTCDAIREELLRLAKTVPNSPLADAGPEEVVLANGTIASRHDAARAVSIAEAMRHGGVDRIQQEKTTRFKNDGSHAHNTHSAIFAEVKVDEQLGVVRVTRIVSAVAAGRILNPKTGRNQVIGGVVWGIGAALHEETLVDHTFGRVMNANIAEYHVPVNADVHDIEVIFVDEQDDRVNPLGIKGLGEIGIVGVPAAIANAIYHATGKRVRDLPITLDKLL
ncbi:xanthine dehydrogenase family protein molybdopterin-binding subunit [Aquabacter sp. CN5-332]|uniref:xanthine dehydrogenase family protein molybdopterin-binding subunit n=1 Tax=Aquabacter sp. CN5-332 TaxID=3156608 RepID=UPI0032B37C8B